MGGIEESFLELFEFSEIKELGGITCKGRGILEMRDFISITKNTLPKKEFFFNFKKLSVHEELCFIFVLHFYVFAYDQQPVETFERISNT